MADTSRQLMISSDTDRHTSGIFRRQKGEPIMADAPVQTSFKRKEKKYLLNRAQYDALRQRLKEHMQEDQYGLSTIMSLYYDNDDFQLIHRSIEKPRYKEKFRLRSYGVPKETTPVFAEIKKKYDGIVYKRRVTAPLSEMRGFLEKGDELSENRQIQKEIRWMFDRYRLKPKVMVIYERIALYGIRDPSLRITFDSNLRYRTTDLALEKGSHGDLFMPEDFYIMEIKFPGTSPLWLVDILDELKIYPGSFSKIGTVCRTRIFT